MPSVTELALVSSVLAWPHPHNGLFVTAVHGIAECSTAGRSRVVGQQCANQEAAEAVLHGAAVAHTGFAALLCKKALAV